MNVEPEDIGRAGCGDLAALRRVRNYWFELATGNQANPQLPRDEALPQTELLAELAAGSGQVEDHVWLIAAYTIRVAALENHKTAAEGLACEAVEANNTADLARWTSFAVEVDERLSCYRAKVNELATATFHSSDPAGPALLIAALTIRADGGDDWATGMIQRIMDSVSPERAEAIQAEVRKIESEPA